MAEYAEVESRIARMSDGELVEMADHPGDYETWALELGRAELKRRRIAPEQVAELQHDNAEMEADRGRRPSIGTHLLIHFGLAPMLALALIGFPFFFLIARDLDRRGEHAHARFIRFVASLAIVAWAMGGISFFVWHWSR